MQAAKRDGQIDEDEWNERRWLHRLVRRAREAQP
jgi:hypothetical protein